MNKTLTIKERNDLLNILESIDEELNIFDELRFLLSENFKTLNSEEKEKILDLLHYGLVNSKIKNESKWISDNFSYFSGNCVGNDMWHKIFKNKQFSFSSMIDYSEYIKSNLSYNFVEFGLRNITVTLRDDVEFNNPDRYKKLTISVLNDILDGKCR